MAIPLCGYGTGASGGPSLGRALAEVSNRPQDGWSFGSETFESLMKAMISMRNAHGHGILSSISEGWGHGLLEAHLCLLASPGPCVSSQQARNAGSERDPEHT